MTQREIKIGKSIVEGGDSKIKIVIIGERKVGKTSILRAFLSEITSNNKEEYFENMKENKKHNANNIRQFLLKNLMERNNFSGEKTVYMGKGSIILRISDVTVDQSDLALQCLSDHLPRDIDVCYIVGDITEPKSIHGMKEWLLKVEEVYNRRDFPVFAILNKIDLKEEVDGIDEIIDLADGGFHRKPIATLVSSANDLESTRIIFDTKLGEYFVGKYNEKKNKKKKKKRGLLTISSVSKKNVSIHKDLDNRFNISFSEDSAFSTPNVTPLREVVLKHIEIHEKGKNLFGEGEGEEEEDVKF